jgi:hypothetical protein
MLKSIPSETLVYDPRKRLNPRSYQVFLKPRRLMYRRSLGQRYQDYASKRSVAQPREEVPHRIGHFAVRP